MVATPASERPLAGVRVVDLSSVVMGPTATLALADYGADVIKVEAPSGDTTRQIPPMRNPLMGTNFLHLNRNKRSVVLDLKSEEGKEALFKIVRTADVVISNIRPKAMGRLGLSPEDLSKAAPRLIIVSLVGFGQSGPYAADPAYEDLIQGATSVPSLVAMVGAPEPTYVPISVSDRTVGLNAAIAILAALLGRERTGKGATIEVPMFETMAQAVLTDHMGGYTFEPPLGPPGYKRQLTDERRPFRTKDGYICTIIYTDKQWKTFCDLVGQPTLMQDDPRFATIGARTEHSNVGYKLIREAMATRTTAEWLDVLRRGDIPVTPLHTLETLFDDPHLNSVGFFQTIDHPTEGKIRSMPLPTRWKGMDLSAYAPAPRLGEHTAEVLAEAETADSRGRRDLM